MSNRAQRRQAPRRELERGLESVATRHDGIMELLTAVVQALGGRVDLDMAKVAELRRLPVTSVIDTDTGILHILVDDGSLPDAGNLLPPDPRSMRQRIANRLIR